MNFPKPSFFRVSVQVLARIRMWRKGKLVHRPKHTSRPNLCVEMCNVVHLIWLLLHTFFFPNGRN